MSPLLDVFVITNNEEELLPYCLESFCLIADLLGVCSIVDNNSTDATLDIVQAYKTRLPIVLQHHRENAHHGHLRNKAISVCQSPWIYYLDSDESFTSDMRDWLLSGQMEGADIWEFFKYTTILDKYHYVEGGNGPTTRLFRNYPGVGFPQSIHTEPQSPKGWDRRSGRHHGPYMFDHTACKSWEALWAKGWRYQWAFREKVPAIGPEHEYVGRVENALGWNSGMNREFPEEIKRTIFTGPDKGLCLSPRRR